MYFCGPTVYQRIHVGNARPFVLSMWLRNWLRERGYEVTLVENVTDVNDKIYAAAPGRSAALAVEATGWYREDTDLLGLGRPDVEPLATETVPEIIALIEELVGRGLAYDAGGDVYFRVARHAEYGALSGNRLEEMVEDPEPSPLKEDPRDFALWKATKPGEDTSWDSPWGRGRPGWHIECSAMAEKFLGPSFEIHGGGRDLLFPHHENEFAQSRGAGRGFARIWMHNGMLRMTGEKMSKSLGNIATLREVVDEWGREVVLLFFMTAHWSKPIDFSPQTLAAASAQVESFRNVARTGPVRATSVADHDAEWAEFAAALDDDFNTPEALSIMHRWRAALEGELLVRALSVFGLGSLGERPTVPEAVTALATERARARDRRDFAAADELRSRIEGEGWTVRDIPQAPGYELVPRS
jgi:cysteinyl-tRNA synthetase